MCIRTGLNFVTGIIVQLPTSWSIDCAVANIAKKAADRVVCPVGNVFPNSQQLYKMAL
jgi:hypothetical protein